MVNNTSFAIVFPDFYKDKVMRLSYYSFYNAIYGCDLDSVKLHIDKGFDPNKCRGEAGWVDSIPLKVLAEGLKGTYISRVGNPTIASKNSDVKVLEVLINNGADINQLPYVRDRIFKYYNDVLLSIDGMEQYSDLEKGLIKQYLIEDVNRLLEAFLKSGADPNMKGHPFPFGYSLLLLIFNDRWAKMYFKSEEATTPLYEAIKKGSKWESQVDLLLQYGASLDESCLEAAKLSNDAIMQEKIQKLWNEKNST